MAINANYLTKETVRNFLRNPSLTIATVLTVAIALTMIGLALVMNEGVKNLSEKYSEEVVFSIWLQDPVSDRSTCQGEDEVLRAQCEADDIKYQNNITAIRNDLESSKLVKSQLFIDREQTFIEFKKYYEDSPEITELVNVNVMPESFKVTPIDTDPAIIKDFREKFAGKPGVRTIQAAEDLIEDVVRFTSVTRWLMWFAAGIAFIASAMLMYNSIRTAVYARRKEIEVMVLVGATKWFVRIPFMFEALLQGLIGALVSIVFVMLINYGLIPEIESIGSRFEGMQLGGELIVISAGLLTVGAGLGAVAAGVTVSKYLDA